MFIVNHTKLTATERSLLSQWKASGLSNKECARRLGRHASTIGRELRRNSYGEVYEPLHAESCAQRRKQRAWVAKHPLKNANVFRYVIQRLLRGWSPEQISGRLREVVHPGEAEWQICAETIYQFIYHPDQKQREWWNYLRRGQKKRRKRGGRKAHRVRIPERVSIHQRPIEIDQREEFGHWEGDTVVGKSKASGLHTSYERVTSMTKLSYMPDLSADSSMKAQIKIYGELPKKARKSTTLDNGSEHVLHKQVEGMVGVKAYFADPYCSWQRGGNENANLWIRYYFPKKTDFSSISPEELQAVEWELNNRPRKRLGFKTPQEVFSALINP